MHMEENTYIQELSSESFLEAWEKQIWEKTQKGDHDQNDCFLREQSLLESTLSVLGEELIFFYLIPSE